MAPGIEPIPPRTAATKALIPGIAPVYGESEGYAEHKSAPAIAARAEPIANVSMMVLFTLMPISAAAPLSSDAASIACPCFVLFINSCKTMRITILTTIVTIVTPWILSCPSKSVIPSHLTTEVKDLMSAPKIKRATFSKR